VILMIAGVLSLAISLIFIMRRNDRRSAQVYEERRYTEPRCEAVTPAPRRAGPVSSPGSRPLPAPLPGASRRAYHPPGVEQERARA
jgi:hypothetical protein